LDDQGSEGAHLWHPTPAIMASQTEVTRGVRWYFEAYSCFGVKDTADRFWQLLRVEHSWSQGDWSRYHDYKRHQQQGIKPVLSTMTPFLDVTGLTFEQRKVRLTRATTNPAYGVTIEDAIVRKIGDVRGGYGYSARDENPLLPITLVVETIRKYGWRFVDPLSMQKDSIGWDIIILPLQVKIDDPCGIDL
jgi:hypothetical protein